ncbi:MAG TPA: epoxide hydrolase [Naasia sp.]
MIDDTIDSVPEADIADLRERLRSFRPVARIGRDGDHGVDGQWLSRVVRHWERSYDWRAREARLAAWPWVRSGTAVPIPAVRKPAGADRPVVLLLHGWPDSVLRFERVLPALEECTVVAPALPGFPFAAETTQGLSSLEIADAVAAAMDDFGHARYVVSAGDVGCDVAEALAARHPDAVRALHLTDISQYHFLMDPPADLDDEEVAYAERGGGGRRPRAATCMSSPRGRTPCRWRWETPR